MLQHSFYNLRLWLAAILIAALAGVHVADYTALIDVPLARRDQPTPVSTGTVNQMVEQYLKRYGFARYQNVIDNSVFDFNVVVKKQPVKIELPPPPPPPPPKPEKPAAPKIKPFTVRLEVTGIAITPERKLVMIWDKVNKESQVLRESEKIRKWKVVLIEKERVILRHDRGKRYEFKINEDTLTNF